MDQRSLDEQITSGFLLAGKTLLAIFTGGALVCGIYGLRSPEKVMPGSFAARHPSLPWVCVIVATAILIPTMNRWVAILPGILGYGTIGGLIMLTTGQYNHVKVPRPVALGLTVFCIVSSYITWKFLDRPLTLIDRVALLAFVFCLAFSMTSKNNIAETFMAMGVGFICVVGAWGIDYVTSARRDAPVSLKQVGHR
jgi:hypothetical protein